MRECRLEFEGGVVQFAEVPQAGVRFLSSMIDYSESLTLREARARFFAANADVFGPQGGYDTKWVRMEIGPIPLYLPNMAGRRRAVVLHDLHHIVTGYSTKLIGETEIGAWEVGTGCRDFWHAWVLNMGAFGLGLVIAPRRVFRAFVRGRHSGTLYDGEFSEALLDETVGGLRRKLRLDFAPPVPRPGDFASFAWWAAASLVVAATGPLALLGLVALLIWLLVL